MKVDHVPSGKPWLFSKSFCEFTPVCMDVSERSVYLQIGPGFRGKMMNNPGIWGTFRTKPHLVANLFSSCIMLSMLYISFIWYNWIIHGLSVLKSEQLVVQSFSSHAFGCGYILEAQVVEASNMSISLAKRWNVTNTNREFTK